MALRLRRDGSLVCAAYYKARKDDIYIDDRLHGKLVDKNRIKTLDGKEWSFNFKQGD